MPTLLPNNKIRIEKGDTLSAIYGPNWKQISGYGGDPNKLPVGTILNAPPSMVQDPKKMDPKAKAAEEERLKMEIAKKQEELVNAQKAEEAKKGQGSGSSASSDSTTTPEWLKSNPEFAKLPKDMQDYVVGYYNILKINDTESQSKLKDALEEAKKQADPYWAEVMRVAQTEVKRSLGEIQGDFDTQEKNLLENISQINQDLTTKKGDLTIDEQAELMRQAKGYERDLETLRSNAAETGLTSSSITNIANERLQGESQDVIESTKSKYMRSFRDLETAAARGITSAQDKLAEFKRILGEQQTSILRSAESKLGTGNLPDASIYPGAKPIGGVEGSYAEDKIKDVYTRAEALAGLGNPFLK